MAAAGARAAAGGLLAGDRTGAIRRYEALRRLPDEEMGVPPMAPSAADESRLWESVHQFLIALSRRQPVAVLAVQINALSSSPVVPPGVYSLVQARLSRLSDPARRILDAAVAVGRVFEFEVAARGRSLGKCRARRAGRTARRAPD